MKNLDKNSLPSSIQAEKAALGCLLLEPNLWDDLVTQIETEMNDSTNGSLTKKSSTLSDTIADYTEKIADMNSDLLDYETQLVRQFTAMEERVGSYNAMKSYLEMQMDIYKKDS